MIKLAYTIGTHFERCTYMYMYIMLCDVFILCYRGTEIPLSAFSDTK